MAKTDTARIDSLEAILAEKRKHEGYLAKLEERRGTTPENVFNRLRDEYLTKLTDLQVRASMESESLHESLRADEEALAGIDARLATATEERVEGELRAEVGEYDPKEWAARLESLNASIAQIEKDRAAKAAEFERTRALLVEARGSVESAASSAPPEASVPSATPAATSVVMPAAATRASVPTPAAVPTRASVPTPAAVPPAAPAARLTPAASVVAPAVPASPAPAPAARPTPMAQPKIEEAAPASASPVAEAPAAVKTPAQGSPMAGSPSFDELAFLNSVVGRASTPVKVDGESEARASGAVRSVPAPAPAPRVSAAVKAPAPAPAPVEEPESALGRPTPRSSQAIKTLKCQECGTLNYPTEWYCERCGGELAAL